MQELLLEKKLTTDFTMGFELEAIWYGGERESKINLFFEDNFGDGGDLHGDGSVHSDDYDDTPFEYASPVMPVNVATFQKIISFFKEHNGKEFYVNESCGFHHHISYPGITMEDVVWIMSKLSLDTKMIEKLKYFEEYKFETGWSNANYLDNLREAVENFDFNSIVRYCNTEKYSLINVHRQKTLEWRGPRGFLEDGNTENIVAFYQRVWQFIKWMTDVLDEKEINGMDRDNFSDQVRAALGNSDRYNTLTNYKSDKKEPDKKMSSQTLDKIYREVIQNPKRLLDFVNSPIPLEQIIQIMYNKNRLGTRIVTLNNESDASIMKRINNVCYKYIPYRMLVQFGDTIDEDTKYNTSELTLKRLFSTSLMDGQSIDSEKKGKAFYGIYKSINPQLFSTQTFYNRVDNPFLDAIAEMDSNLDFLKTMIQNMNNIDSEIRQIIVVSYLNINGQGFSPSRIKELLQICGSHPEVVRSINAYLHKNALKYPREIIPLLTFNEKSLLLLISRAKASMSTEQFYDVIKQTLVSSGKISEEEFNNIDRDLTKPSYSSVSDDSVEHLYHDEEITY